MRFYFLLVLLVISSQASAQAEPAQPAGSSEGETTPAPSASQPARDAELAAAEEELMAAAAADAAGEQEPSRNRMGGSLGMEGRNELYGARARGFGTSIAFSYKGDDPFAMVFQVGAIAWPSAFFLNEENEVPHKAPWEVFLAASLLPFTFGPVDLGFFVRLSAKHFFTTIADRAEFGLAMQWQIDRTWALRYQAGCSIITNFQEPTLVSSLALDLTFPSLI
jgi:hypothetical protein